MTLHFTKMEGAGNDYVYVNGITQHVPQEQKPDVVRRLSDRHFGIGGDGVIFINRGKKAQFEMEMYNADGSRAEMCGNGIRCVGKFVYDRGMTQGKEFTVESFGSVKYLKVKETDEFDNALTLEVNMGAPILAAKDVPAVSETDENAPIIDAPIEVCGKQYRMTCVSMGNPHAVVFVDDTASFDLEGIGPHFETHERFPNRTNTEFVQVISRNYVKMRVWERGTGETLACGTGCCATGVACVLNDVTDDELTVEVLGGKIGIRWDREANLVYMTGPATEVFTGEVEI